ncbi:ATP-dependent DNA helicase RecG [Mariprofundus erugo]|uniref:ATP-dependent DNA helicase RecG n=1 Tax=Mariprofundus erugo TaxID=2528639 RepID=UPI0010FDF7D6|nr:ATP-dependent DNA helicase RecG [Mariprofundus erugo]TLS75633.1 ATP-dependent DNA helicase RecG [Mariprofundus erugo]
MYQYMALPLSAVKGIGPSLEKRLHGRGIDCIGNLLLHLPLNYIDDRRVSPISLLREGESGRIEGRIISKEARGYGKDRQVWIRLADDHGQIRLNFFHAGFMMGDARLTEGRLISVRGVAERWQGQWQMTHPEWCVAEAFEPGYQPHYGALAGLSGKRIGTMIRQALLMLPATATSPLDHILMTQYRMPSLRQALLQLHQPHAADSDMLRHASSRLKSEEIILYLLLMLDKKRQADCPGILLASQRLSSELLEQLPFPLTDAQQSAWQDISADMTSGRRMHRLLQGDVGAGKTWVAALAMASVAGSGYQAALLAPTSVLASQHAITLRELLMPLGLDVALLTGSTRAAERRKILAALASGKISLVVGTHALLTDDVCFDHLALALVDEQHRFGVRQRWALAEKRKPDHQAVHLLAMTATPIPRTLALALYGDMDLSMMRGMPPGRKPIETRVISADKMRPLADGMQRMLDVDGRIYWIVPRIDEDDDGISVDQRVELLKGYFPAAGVLGLHGRMKASVKDEVLQAFASGACKILVSTTVVEVGVNIPEARLMIVEQAESYGLAQLHQLRGRVGRSSEQGYCMLIAGKQASQSSLGRLQQLVRSHDGLELAEADLAMRGSGDAIGTRQHGDAGFRLINLAGDGELIRQWYEHLPDFAADEAMLRFWRPFADSAD